MHIMPFCSLGIHFVLLRGIPQLLCHWTSTQMRTLSAPVITIVRSDIGASRMVAVLEFSRSKTCVISLQSVLNNRNLFLFFVSLSYQLCVCYLQGGATHMRFQPSHGRILAAAADNIVSILDVEKQVCRLKLQVFFPTPPLNLFA